MSWKMLGSLSSLKIAVYCELIPGSAPYLIHKHGKHGTSIRFYI